MAPIEYGLVLAGGGAKGIYQIGAWRAIRELEIPITCVVGTSVGAMNGARVACGQYEGAVALWENMSIEKGFALPEPLRVPDNLFHVKNADIVVKELFHSLSKEYPDLREKVFSAMQRLPLPAWEPQDHRRRPLADDGREE